MSAPLPDQLDERRHQALVGRGAGVWARRVILLLFLALVCLGLADVFGQGEVRSQAAAASAGLTVQAPLRLRGGLLYQSTITVRARRRITKPRLVLAAGWVRDVTLNTVIPAPADEASAPAGGVVLAYGPIAAGGSLRVRLQSQVNPLARGRYPQDVELRDGAVPLVRVHRTMTAFP